MSHTPHRQLSAMVRRQLRLPLAIGLVMAVVLMAVATATPVGASVPVSGWTAAVLVQATSPADQTGAPRLQPVGNGDRINSPVEATEESRGDDRAWGWRVVFGAAVVAVVLIALIQRRQDPEGPQAPGRGRPGSTSRRGGSDRNALGH